MQPTGGADTARSQDIAEIVGLEPVFDALPVAIYTTDAEGMVTHYNRAAADLAGREPEIGKDRWCVTWRLYRPDGSSLPHDECPMAMTLKEGRAVRGQQAIAERPDGTRVPFLAHPTPLFDRQGKLVGAVNMLVDLSDNRRAEAALMRQTVRAEKLNNVAKVLSGDLDLERVLQTVIDTATDLAGAQFGAFVYKTGEGDAGSYRFHKISGPANFSPDELAASFGGPFVEPILHGVAIRSHDIRNDRHFAGVTHLRIGDREIVSYLGVPVIGRSGEVRGGLLFGHEQAQAFSRETEDFVVGFAAHAAIAIDNAELLTAANVEIERRRQAERAQDLLAAIVTSSSDAIVSKDLNGIIATWNKGAERLFGYTADEIIGKPVLLLIPPDLQGEEPRILERIRRGERIEHYETVRRRQDGSLVDVSLSVSPVRDRDGRIVGASKIARDISERKRAERDRDLLVAELSHRVKNTLATVISVAQRTFADDMPMEQARRSFEGRIRALAQTHSRLAETSWVGVPLETVLFDELAPYRKEDVANLELSGDSVDLNSRSAVTLGMAFHELATNAAKYGALSVATGRVIVNWHSDPKERQLHIHWREVGGPPVKSPSRNGFGRLLLERVLTADLKGSVEMRFAASGLDCTISFPIDDNVRSAV